PPHCDGVAVDIHGDLYPTTAMDIIVGFDQSRGAPTAADSVAVCPQIAALTAVPRRDGITVSVYGDLWALSRASVVGFDQRSRAPTAADAVGGGTDAPAHKVVCLLPYHDGIPVCVSGDLLATGIGSDQCGGAPTGTEAVAVGPEVPMQTVALVPHSD